MRTRTKKGADRAWLPLRRGVGHPLVGGGRGRSLSGDPAARPVLGKGRGTGAPTARVHPRRDREAADPLPARHGGGAGRAGGAGAQRGPASVAPTRTGGAAGRTAAGRRSGRSGPAMVRLGLERGGGRGVRSPAAGGTLAGAGDPGVG